MGLPELDHLERYKSYVQRRRVGSAPPEISLLTPVKTSSYHSETKTDSLADTYKGFFSYDRKAEDENDLKDDIIENSLKDTYSHSYDGNRSRSEANPYKRLYGNNRKHLKGVPHSGTYRGYGSTGHSEIRDNRTTVLAVKVIKQALACFALLGIIVVMQQREDMAGVLAFVKKQVVDVHIDAQSIFSGVENIVKECTQLIRGTP